MQTLDEERGAPQDSLTFVEAGRPERTVAWSRFLDLFHRLCGSASIGPKSRPRFSVAALSSLPGFGSSRLRNIRIEDLLQREETRIDLDADRKIVAGRSVLITGAGGSIGSELARQVAGANPRNLLLLDKCENGLFYAHLETRERLGAARVKPLLVDLLCRDALRGIVRTERPELVFHAAAHKHVALLESHPHEAIRNNVLGTRNIAQAALEWGAAAFVNISTDKAVKPLSYMGLSKKITELCIQELASEFGARFCNVRFGNVAGTTGSVIPLFENQIEKGGPLHVSDARATRYFMSAREAAHLILRAATLTRGGETFVMDMGAPVNIFELAGQMARLAGFRPGIDLRVEFTGLKEGEKLAEQLYEPWEHLLPAGSDGIFAIRDESPLACGIWRRIDRMEELLSADDREGLRLYLRQLFPDFKRTAPHVLPMRRSAGEASRPRAQAL